MWGEMLNKQLIHEAGNIFLLTLLSKKKYKQSSQLIFQIAMRNLFHGHIFNLQANVLVSLALLQDF